MIIRRADRNDKKELVRLRKDFFHLAQSTLSPIQAKIRAYKNMETMTADAEETVNTYLSQPECVVFVADEGRLLKGYISGEIKSKKHKIYDKEGYVDHWFVEKEFQKQGVGRKLFDSLIEEFKKVGCTHIALDTHIENQNAIATYQHLGFIERLVTFFKPLQDL